MHAASASHALCDLFAHVAISVVSSSVTASDVILHPKPAEVRFVALAAVQIVQLKTAFLVFL